MNDTPAELHQAVRALCERFEKLTPQDLDALMAWYATDVRFVDPFNDVHNRAAMRRVFEDMFERLQSPRFTVRHWAVAGTTAYLRWDFDFAIPLWRSTQAGHIEGMSELHWMAQPDGQWRVRAHWDHWDAGAQVYARLPVLGWLIRRVQRRLSA